MMGWMQRSNTLHKMSSLRRKDRSKPRKEEVQHEPHLTLSLPMEHMSRSTSADASTLSGSPLPNDLMSLSESLSIRQQLSLLSNNRYFGMLLPIAISSEEIKLLRESFTIVKHNAKEAGLAVMEKMMAIPESAGIFRNSPNRVIRTGDKWELINQGMTIMHGIERFLLRLDKSDHLGAYCLMLIKNHQKYGVTTEQLLLGFGIFVQVLMDRLAVMHKHDNALSQQDSHDTVKSGDEEFFDIDDTLFVDDATCKNETAIDCLSNSSVPTNQCATCAAWLKFHGLMSVLITTFKTASKISQKKEQAVV